MYVLCLSFFQFKDKWRSENLVMSVLKVKLHLLLQCAVGKMLQILRSARMNGKLRMMDSPTVLTWFDLFEKHTEATL